MFLKRTPTYPWSQTPVLPFHPQMKGGIPKHKLEQFWGLGYVPGVCWKILRLVSLPDLQRFAIFFGMVEIRLSDLWPGGGLNNQFAHENRPGFAPKEEGNGLVPQLPPFFSGVNSLLVLGRVFLMCDFATNKLNQTHSLDTSPQKMNKRMPNIMGLGFSS